MNGKVKLGFYRTRGGRLAEVTENGTAGFVYGKVYGYLAGPQAQFWSEETGACPGARQNDLVAKDPRWTNHGDCCKCSYCTDKDGKKYPVFCSDAIEVKK